MSIGDDRGLVAVPAAFAFLRKYSPGFTRGDGRTREDDVLHRRWSPAINGRLYGAVCVSVGFGRVCTTGVEIREFYGTIRDVKIGAWRVGLVLASTVNRGV